MDSGDGNGPVDVSGPRSEGLVPPVGEKRPAEDGGLGAPEGKKARTGGGLVGNMRQVAERVLVLAAMGMMRAGRSPTAAENEMMAEARGKLAEVCERFAPKDLFPTDACGTVIEDLGLSKPREQRLGFRPPKMSIAEKLLFTKRKMEKSEELSSRAATNSSQSLQTNLGAAAESRGASHMTRMFPSDKSSHPPVSSGGFQPASPFARGSVANSTPLPYQLPATGVRTSLASSASPSSLIGKDSSSSSMPRVDRPQLRLDPRLNGSSYTSQNQVNSSGDQTQLKTPVWSHQSQSMTSGKTGSDNKLVQHPAGKMEGTADMTSTRVAPQAATSKPLIPQTTSGLPSTVHMQGMNFVQAPLLTNVHHEIGKIVQKLLQPQLPQHPTWIPPSRDYMNKLLTCQVCKLGVNEVDNVLICDNCDKGYHLKCLQSHNPKGVPKGEWHCFKCVSLSNGKPLPPKYGRVTRNISGPKLPSNTAAVHPSPGKVAPSGEKGNQQKITANGNSGLLRTPVVGMGSNHFHSASDSNKPNVREMQENGVLSSAEKVDDKHYFGTYPSNIISSTGVAFISSDVVSSIDRSYEVNLAPELKRLSPAKPSEIGHLQASSNTQNNDQEKLPSSSGAPSMQCHEDNLTVTNSEKSQIRKTSNGILEDDVKQDGQVLQAAPVKISGTSNPASECSGALVDVLNDVDWIGDVLQVVDERTYYRSSCVNGVVYTVQDHALFCSNNGKLIPYKVQAMWEDNKTRSKWCLVNRCYFPDDLPEAVGRPCSPESNEVYESTHGSTKMVGLIQGPCIVLPPGKFIEESERRSRLGAVATGGLWPLFLCKWFYDEPKGVFRDVSI
ncbi:uncharacterized protein LOC127811533 [Diospyros lotus]|uniref:uncharacterized protein LOC127811533 n=1 Tax=Diospyros lotus TaxID=55363 RepID=UPI00224E7648|nr:uncharacterized protein LOC127811533 [Diospyros lotus]